MQVNLISFRSEVVTGLSRYAQTLLEHMDDALEMRSVVPDPQIPSIVRQLGNRINLDAQGFLRQYPVTLKQAPADLYHIASENLGTLLLRKTMSPVVVTVHGLQDYILRDTPYNMYAHPAARFFDQLSVNGILKAEHLIFVSRYLQDYVIDQLGYPAEQTSVVYNGIDHSTFKQVDVPPEVYTKYDLDPAKRYVLYVGSEQPRKNFLNLLKAFAIVRQQHDDVILLKVGQPESQEQRQLALDFIEEAKLNASVQFLPHLANDLPYVYNLATVFAFPSRSEGFGWPPVEAMACGAPVVCTNTASLPEVVGEAALLIEPEDVEQIADSIHRFLDDEALRQKYVALGLANAQRFTWSDVAQQTQQVYERVV